MTEVAYIDRLSEVAGQPGQIMGGGTILMREVNYAPQTLPHLICLRDPALKEIRRDRGGILIGAGVTMSDVIRAPELSALAPVARSIGGPALRNMATIGGNLFAAHPYGDFTVALLALEARVIWASGQEEEIETFLSRRDTTQGAVAGVVIPDVRPEQLRYKKVSRTKPKGISVMSIAFFGAGYGSRVENPRLAFGAMATTPRRAKAAEAILQGGSLDDAALIERAAQAAVGDLDPFDDAIASAWYRSQVAPVHLKRLLMGEGR